MTSHTEPTRLSSTGLSRAVDSILDRLVAPGFTSAGLAVRMRLPTWPDDPRAGALSSRRFVVSGPTSGLGRATAAGLASLGADLVLIARNEEKVDREAATLRSDFPGVDVVTQVCDLGDLEAVRATAGRLCEAFPELHGVVHNAGVMPPERTESPQGHELSMAVHVLGPVLLTDLLRPSLRRHGSRVVLVTSGGAYGQRLRPDDPEFLDGSYSPTAAYARSKQAQLELLPSLATRWNGDGISVWATHPGWADTPGVQDSLPRFRRITRPLLRDAKDGADTTIWLCGTNQPPPDGTLVHDRRVRPTHLLARTHTPDAEVARMWQWSLDQLGLT